MRDLLNDLDNAKEEVVAAADEVTSAPKGAPEPDGKSSELIRLSEDGDIEQSPKYIKKASVKVVDKIYDEYDARRLEKSKQFLTDLVISRFADILRGLNAIEYSEALNDDLQKDRLLKSNLWSIVRQLTPYVPALDILSGEITTSKHVYTTILVKKRTRKVTKKRQSNPPYSMETLRETSLYPSLTYLYLRPNNSMTKAKDMLDSERATAHGVKCKAKRKAVLKSLNNLLHILSSHTTTQYGVAMVSNGTIVVPRSP